MATATTPHFEEKRKAERRASGQLALLTFLPHSLLNTRYRLKEGLNVYIHRDEGRIIVSELITGAFTSDEDLGQAVGKFISAFVEEFELLKKQEASLSPAMAADLENFRRLIEESAP